MIKPITPDEADSQKLSDIPDGVIQVFNDLIKENLVGGKAIVQQNDAVRLICERLNVERHIVFEKHWLDVEPLFEDAGWNVMFDKPAYNENYEAHFLFTKRK